MNYIAYGLMKLKLKSRETFEEHIFLNTKLFKISVI